MASRVAGRLGQAGLGAAVAAAGWSAGARIGLSQVLGVPELDGLAVAIVIGAVAGALNGLRWVAGLAGALLLLLVAVAWVPGLGTLGRSYIRTDPLPDRAVDAVVVLSGAVSEDGRISGVAVDRLLEGARLVKAGVARRLVLDRVFAFPGRDTVSSERDQRSLTAIMGVDSAVVMLGPVGPGSTRLEAVWVKALADREGWRRVVLVTSPIHTRRACATFEGAGLAVVCRPSPDRLIALKRLQSPGDRTMAFAQWLYETLGWWKYRLRGWIRPR